MRTVKNSYFLFFCMTKLPYTFFKVVTPSWCLVSLLRQEGIGDISWLIICCLCIISCKPFFTSILVMGRNQSYILLVTLLQGDCQSTQRTYNSLYLTSRARTSLICTNWLSPKSLLPYILSSKTIERLATLSYSPFILILFSDLEIRVISQSDPYLLQVLYISNVLSYLLSSQ